MSVNRSVRSGGIIGIYFKFFNMTVSCVFSLESPHRGDSNENIQYTIFNIKKKITLSCPKSAAMGFRSKGLKKEFETTMVNEPSVFEPLKFYCISWCLFYVFIFLFSLSISFVLFLTFRFASGMLKVTHTLSSIHSDAGIFKAMFSR